MKYLALLLLVTTGSATAVEKSLQQRCEGIFNLAKKIMEVRQYGEQTKKQMLLRPVDDVQKQIINKAYSFQVYEDPVYKADMVRWFQHEMKQDCFKGKFNFKKDSPKSP